MAAASALLMILVCINIASLLGQHAARRRRELATLTALGAAPGRIASHVLVETGILAACGAVAGWSASLVLSKALYLLLPDFGFSLALNLQNNVRTEALAAALGVLVTIVCGLVPLRQSLRVSQRAALHEGGASVTGTARKRTGQQILLGFQLGICFMALVCCGVLTHTAVNIFRLDPGFDRRNTLTAGVDLSRSGYSQERAQVFLTALRNRLRNAPGVESASRLWAS